MAFKTGYKGQYMFRYCSLDWKLLTKAENKIITWHKMIRMKKDDVMHIKNGYSKSDLEGDESKSHCYIYSTWNCTWKLDHNLSIKGGSYLNIVWVNSLISQDRTQKLMQFTQPRLSTSVIALGYTKLRVTKKYHFAHLPIFCWFGVFHMSKKLPVGTPMSSTIPRPLPPI